jgi:hypothetical protein
VPIYAYGPVVGQRPTLGGVRHPTPGTADLQWRFSLQVANMGANNGQPALVVAGTTIQGNHVDQPWSDMWSGSSIDWGQNAQRIVPSGTSARLLIWLSGPTSAYSMRVGGRLGGFTQNATAQKTALANAIRR